MTIRNEERAREYWRRNIALMAKLLVVWFVVSYGCGILWVDYLNQFRIGGYKLGFWFAQQGSIYVFVVLIFVYARRMAALDHEFGVDLDNGDTDGRNGEDPYEHRQNHQQRNHDVIRDGQGK